MTKHVIRKYKMLLIIIPIILSGNTSVGQVTTTNQPSTVSVQNISEKINELSNRTQQLEDKFNIVDKQCKQILQEHLKQSSKLNNIEQKQNTLQNQVQSNNIDINAIRQELTNSKPKALPSSKDDTFAVKKDETFARQHAQNIFNELQNAKTIDERKAIFEKYPDELNFIKPIDKVKYVAGDLPIDQNLNKQLTDNAIQKYNPSLYDASNLFNNSNTEQNVVHQNPVEANNNINKSNDNIDNIIYDLQKANTAEEQQKILQKYPSISEIIDSNEMKQYLEKGIPFTPKDKEQISSRIAADNIINKLKDPNISKEEKQKILQEHPAVLQILGNPDNINQYVDGTVPFPSNFKNELSQDLLANNIVDKLNNPNTTPQQRHEILQQYPEIIRMINNGDSNIDAEKYKNYINGKVPFNPQLKKLLSNEFNKPQQVVSPIPEINSNVQQQTNNQNNANRKLTPLDIKSVQNELLTNKPDNKILKDSNDVLIESPNRLKLDKIYDEMSKADNPEKRANIVNKYPELKNLPNINEYIQNGKQIDVSPIQTKIQNNKTPESYNKLVNNIANGLNMIDNLDEKQQDINNKPVKLEALNENDFPYYSKDDSSIDFIKMSKSQLISELQKCKNTCKLLQESSKMPLKTQTLEISNPTQITIPNTEELLKESNQNNTQLQENTLPQTAVLQDKNVLEDNNKVTNNNIKEVLNNDKNITNQNSNIVQREDGVLKALKNKQEEKHDAVILSDNNLEQMFQLGTEEKRQNDIDSNNKNVVQNILQNKQNIKHENENQQQYKKNDIVDSYNFPFETNKNQPQVGNNENSTNTDNQQQLPSISKDNNVKNGTINKQLADNISKTSLNNLSQENFGNETINLNMQQVQNEVNAVFQDTNSTNITNQNNSQENKNEIFKNQQLFSEESNKPVDLVTNTPTSDIGYGNSNQNNNEIKTISDEETNKKLEKIEDMSKALNNNGNN